jgi:hypothetical protein
MSPRRFLVPVLVALALGVAACGGGSSGGGGASTASSSTAPSAASSGGGAATGSDADFCTTFAQAKDLASVEGLPSKDDLAKIKKFADDLDRSAPAAIKSDVAILTAYFRFIADAAGNLGSNPTTEPSGLPGQITKAIPALANISVWGATHCTGASSPASAAAPSGS